MLGVDARAARAWLAEQEPEAAAAPGEDDPTRPLAVWPVNWPVLQLFLRLQTQWHHGPTGRPEGLRYEAVHVRMLGMGVPEAERAALWDQLEDMEHAVLEVWDEL